MDKVQLRKKMLAVRDNLNPLEREENSRIIIERLKGLPVFQHASLVMTYVGCGSEVKTLPFIHHCLAAGKRVAVPVCVPKTRELRVAEIKDLQLDLQPACFGLLEPPPERQVLIDPGQVDLMVMPGVAFDRQGARLGYGGGYYDRFLSSLVKRPPLIALAFQCQLVEIIPAEKYDVSVDVIITEREIVGLV